MIMFSCGLGRRRYGSPVVELTRRGCRRERDMMLIFYGAARRRLNFIRRASSDESYLRLRAFVNIDMDAMLLGHRRGYCPGIC